MQLCVASREGRPDEVREALQIFDTFLQYGENITVEDVASEATKAFWLAVRGGHVECARQLCARGLDIPLVDEQGQSALEVAAKGGRTDLVRYLVDSDSMAAADALLAMASELAGVRNELAILQRMSNEKDVRIADLETRAGPSSLNPYMIEVQDFARTIPNMTPSDEPVMVPVAVLRFTHHSVNADLAFGESHENKQESIFKLVDALFRGHIQPEHIEPLDVFLHHDPDGHRALFSRNNRRLFALFCNQAVRRDTTIRVPCRVYLSSDRRRSPAPGKTLAQWFAEGYDEQGSRDGCNGRGLSIWPRPVASTSRHRGYDLFNPPVVTQRALERLASRHEEVAGRVSTLLGTVTTRRVGDDEDTLTLQSESSAVAVAANRQQRSARRRGRRSSGWYGDETWWWR